MVNSSYPQRRAQRAPHYDYATPGYYFVTICVRDRLHLFGTVRDGEMHPSPAGNLIPDLWEEIPDRYPGAGLDTFIVMPDHIHAIVSLTDGAHSLTDIVHHLKSRTTAQYAKGVREKRWPPFPGTLWQRGFYDRVIRDEEELRRTREYILQNPLRWTLRHQDRSSDRLSP